MRCSLGMIGEQGGAGWRSHATGVLALLLACNSGEPDPPQLQRLRQPTGALLTPDGAWLMVANGNLDQLENASTLVGIDLGRLDAAMAATPLLADATPTEEQPCRRTADDDVSPLECEPRFFIEREHAIRLPTGAGNIALDRPSGDEGPLRLLIPSGAARTVTWVDVVARRRRRPRARLRSARRRRLRL